MGSVPPYLNLPKALLVACALVLPNGCSSGRKPAAAPPTPVVVTEV